MEKRELCQLINRNGFSSKFDCGIYIFLQKHRKSLQRNGIKAVEKGVENVNNSL